MGGNVEQGFVRRLGCAASICFGIQAGGCARKREGVELVDEPCGQGLEPRLTGFGPGGFEVEAAAVPVQMFGPV